MSGTQRQIIDLNLPNVSKHEAKKAYYRAVHLLRRRVLLQEWAELLPADADGVGELIIGRCRAGVHPLRNAE